MWLVLKKRGIHRNSKIFLRIMKKYGLLAEIRRRRKWQQIGQQLHDYERIQLKTGEAPLARRLSA